MHSALFLDLGGTLLRIHENEIFIAPDGAVEILPNVLSRLSTVEQDVVLVVTNQSGIEKGTLTTRQVRTFIEQLNRATQGLIDDYWACPFVASAFRKPGMGMVTALADKHYIDLRRSVYVGDTADDHHCALAAGVGQFIWAHEFFHLCRWKKLPSNRSPLTILNSIWRWNSTALSTLCLDL